MTSYVSWFEIAAVLAPFVAVAIWSRWRRGAKSERVLVAVGARPRFSTRPPLVKRPEDLALLKEIGEAIDRAGLGPARVLMFLGRPSMDIVVDAKEPEVVLRELATVLGSFPVALSAVGRAGDLAWHARLWRHM